MLSGKTEGARGWLSREVSGDSWEQRGQSVRSGHAKHDSPVQRTLIRPSSSPSGKSRLGLPVFSNGVKARSQLFHHQAAVLFCLPQPARPLQELAAGSREVFVARERLQSVG